MTSTRTLLAAAAFPLAALCLSACASQPPGAPLLSPISQYSLKVGVAVDRIALAPHAGGLSQAQRQALQALAARRAEAGGGVVTISLPRGAADAAATGATADAVQAQLAATGAPVQRASYDSGDSKAPLLVSFDYDKADIPRCGGWSDLTATGENRVYANFGCAVTANMAAMIANPADIRGPRAEGPGDAERRMTVLDKYEAGKVTAAETPSQTPNIAHIGQ
jgi:pilus assembly protein CpaD